MRTDDAGGEAPPGREAVEWYFGELVGEVARESPVSYGRLANALASLELTAVESTASPIGRVRYRGPDESVVTVTNDRWDELTGGAKLTDLEAAAARETHRRMAAALGVSPNEEVAVVIRDAAEAGDNRSFK